MFVGIKIAEKRSLPCPHRLEWYTARDNLYEEIMEKSWNAEKGFFAQSYEDKVRTSGFLSLGDKLGWRNGC